MGHNAFLSIQHVTKTYKTGSTIYEALSPISFNVEKGQFVSIIGPSGCGKSTLLHMIAGIHQCDTGEIILNGEKINKPGKDRGMVFQNYALYPWMTVKENIMFAVNAVQKKLSNTEKEKLVKKYLQLVKLEQAADKKPTELSGGMKQRVGIARALVTNPKVLLLDEPLGALDALTREELQEELGRICKEEQKTVVMVTHDIEEAILLSDKIVVMSQGPAARIVETIEVDIKGPKHKEAIIDHPEFLRLRRLLMSLLSDRINHAKKSLQVVGGNTLDD